MKTRCYHFAPTPYSLLVKENGSLQVQVQMSPLPLPIAIVNIFVTVNTLKTTSKILFDDVIVTSLRLRATHYNQKIEHAPMINCSKFHQVRIKIKEVIEWESAPLNQQLNVSFRLLVVEIHRAAESRNQKYKHKISYMSGFFSQPVPDPHATSGAGRFPQ